MMTTQKLSEKHPELLLAESWEQLVRFICNQLKSVHYQGGRISVACSGGMDSMLVATAVDAVCKASGNYTLRLLHFNYGLRGGESDADQQLVEEFAKTLGAECISLKDTSLVGTASGIQAKARDLRYQWFASVCHPEEPVFLGHHRDDIRETCVFRLSRGVAWHQLLGMSEISGRYFRPLLPMDKSWIAAQVTRQNVPFRHDLSNDKLIYKRNIVRHKTLPALEAIHQGAPDHIVNLAGDLSEIATWLMATLGRDAHHHGNKIEGVWLRNLPPSVGEIALRMLTLGKATPLLDVPRKRIRAILASFSKDNRRVHLANIKGGYSLLSEKGFVYLAKKKGTQSGERLTRFKPILRREIFQGSIIPFSRIEILGDRHLIVTSHVDHQLELKLQVVEHHQKVDFVKSYHDDTEILPEFVTGNSREGAYPIMVFVDNQPKAVYKSGFLWEYPCQKKEFRLVDWMISIQDR